MGKRPDMKERMKGKGADIFFENTSAQRNEHAIELDSVIDLDNDSKLPIAQDREIDSTQATEQDTDKDTDKNAVQYTNKYTTQDTAQDTTQYTEQCTTNVTDKKDNNKYVIQIEKTEEPYNRRLVANVTATQKQYIKTVAKKNKIKESEFVRIMIDFF